MIPHVERSKDLPNLDILRAVAVLLVLGDHVLESLGHRYATTFHPYDWYMGRLGVVLFFVHTSLVLMWSMERLRLQGWALFKSFYIRRAFRIYPLSVACVIGVTIFAVPVRPWEPFVSPTPGELTSNVLLTMNLAGVRSLLAPLWSLPIEVQMYLALPIIFMLVAGAPLRTTFLLYAGAIACGLIISPISARLTVLYFAPCFMSGVIAYRLADSYRFKLSGALWLPFVLLMIAAYFTIESFAANVHSTQAQWLVALAVGVLIPAFHQSRSNLINKPAFEVAKYSYGIYLFHNVALWLGCHVLEAPEPVRWLVTLTLLSLFSVGSFHLLESPLVRFGARLAAGSERRAARLSRMGERFLPTDT